MSLLISTTSVNMLRGLDEADPQSLAFNSCGLTPHPFAITAASLARWWCGVTFSANSLMFGFAFLRLA